MAKDDKQLSFHYFLFINIFCFVITELSDFKSSHKLIYNRTFKINKNKKCKTVQHFPTYCQRNEWIS